MTARTSFVAYFKKFLAKHKLLLLFMCLFFFFAHWADFVHTAAFSKIYRWSDKWA